MDQGRSLKDEKIKCSCPCPCIFFKGVYLLHGLFVGRDAESKCTTVMGQETRQSRRGEKYPKIGELGLGSPG